MRPIPCASSRPGRDGVHEEPDALARAVHDPRAGEARRRGSRPRRRARPARRRTAPPVVGHLVPARDVVVERARRRSRTATPQTATRKTRSQSPPQLHPAVPGQRRRTPRSPSSSISPYMWIVQRPEVDRCRSTATGMEARKLTGTRILPVAAVALPVRAGSSAPAPARAAGSEQVDREVQVDVVAHARARPPSGPRSRPSRAVRPARPRRARSLPDSRCLPQSSPFSYSDEAAVWFSPYRVICRPSSNIWPLVKVALEAERAAALGPDQDVPREPRLVARTSPAPVSQNRTRRRLEPEAERADGQVDAGLEARELLHDSRLVIREPGEEHLLPAVWSSVAISPAAHRSARPRPLRTSARRSVPRRAGGSAGPSPASGARAAGSASRRARSCRADVEEAQDALRASGTASAIRSAWSITQRNRAASSLQGNACWAWTKVGISQPWLRLFRPWPRGCDRGKGKDGR